MKLFKCLILILSVTFLSQAQSKKSIPYHLLSFAGEVRIHTDGESNFNDYLRSYSRMSEENTNNLIDKCLNNEIGTTGFANMPYFFESHDKKAIGIIQKNHKYFIATLSPSSTSCSYQLFEIINQEVATNRTVTITTVLGNKTIYFQITNK